MLFRSGSVGSGHGMAGYILYLHSTDSTIAPPPQNQRFFFFERFMTARHERKDAMKKRLRACFALQRTIER